MGFSMDAELGDPGEMCEGGQTKPAQTLGVAGAEPRVVSSEKCDGKITQGWPKQPPFL